ncbi:hypothetical protein HYV91_02205 [Candidatus Wolfebacteria bacterium]|nr:hypothetical protein [Candidatus Wolfebacteria bacterium]
MRKGEIIPKILEILQVQAEATADLLDIFTSNYGDSCRKLGRSIKYGPTRFKTDWASLYRERQSFYSMLNHLKQQGLIKKRKNELRKGSVWQITKRGLKKLNLIKNQEKFPYKKETSDKLIIVTFDIPEKDRQKREWLRSALRVLDFSLLQESVWIGKNEIPQEFLYDLRKREIMDFVHILEINKEGTLSKALAPSPLI